MLFITELDFYYFPFIYVFIVITLISLIYCLSYNTGDIITFYIYISFIIFSGFGLFFTNSFFLFFLFYEFLLLPSFIILYKYAKTRRSVEASFLMFFWTQFGALFLIIAILFIYRLSDSSLFSNLNNLNLTLFESNILFLFLLVGFGVKLPIWPFYDWLPKAHVEASTNFSIFLSGVLVKFAFFGFFKFLISIGLDNSFIFTLPYITYGLIDSVLKTYYQIDIKKLIAYATVAEMHWLLLCIISGYNIMWFAGFSMLIAHAIISTNSFLMVDSITRRYKTRYITELSGINFLSPKLFILILINCIIFLGFPGSLFFISELLFFSFLLDLLPVLYIIIIVFIYLFLAIFFLRVWMSVLFGSINNNFNTIKLDVDKVEFTIFLFLIMLIFLLGISFQMFVI